MAGDHRLESAQKALQPLSVVKAVQEGYQVGVSLLLQQVMEQKALLQGPQRIDVLNVAGSARHRGDDPIERGLLQAHQGQQLGRQPGAIRWNAVRRHRHLVPVAHH